MNELAIRQYELLVRNVKQAEENDPHLRPLKDAVVLACRQASDAMLTSEDSLVPADAQHAVDEAIRKLATHTRLN